MTSDDFRNLVLVFDGVVESSHMGHPDFRFNGKIFATLNAGETLGMVKLTPEQQSYFIEKQADAFSPCNGAWGKGGATFIDLASVNESFLLEAVETAWRNISAN